MCGTPVKLRINKLWHSRDSDSNRQGHTGRAASETSEATILLGLTPRPEPQISVHSASCQRCLRTSCTAHTHQRSRHQAQNEVGAAGRGIIYSLQYSLPGSEPMHHIMMRPMVATLATCTSWAGEPADLAITMTMMMTRPNDVDVDVERISK